MTTVEIIGLGLACILMLLGVAGAIVPGLPSTPLVLAAAIGHKIWFGDESVHGWVLAVLVVLTILSLLVDYGASVLGARRLGASRRGMIGALLGTVVGVVAGLFLGGVGSIAGLFLGPLVGATLLERAGARPWPEAFRAGLGATLGILAGTVGKVCCALLMLALFAADVLWRNLG